MDVNTKICNRIIHLKGIVDEDFVNYKLPSMFLITCRCDWKCCKESNIPISSCQNQELVNRSNISYYLKDIINSYLNNDITKAVVIGGLEPFMQYSEILDFIDLFRHFSDDDIVIYTGYNKSELEKEINELKQYKNIVLKYGRYIPNQNPHFDNVLGIELVSDNQYAEKISCI